MLQLIATWPINPSCDSFYKSDKILSNAPEIHYTFVYVMVHFFFQLKYYPVLQKCFFFLFVCLFVFFQSETVIYLVTEPVRPLEVQLDEEEKSDLAISWGLHQITVSIILNRHT